MPETILESAFQRATPGFDSRVSLLVNEAERIRQNRALAEQQNQKLLEEDRKFQQKLFLEQAKSDMTLNRQVNLELFKQELSRPEKLLQSMLDTQTNLNNTYSLAKKHGLGIPDYIVVPDNETGTPLITWLETIGEGNEKRSVRRQVTEFEFNNLFSTAADAADLIEEAQNFITNPNTDQFSSTSGVGRQELINTINEVRNGIPDAVQRLRNQITSVSQNTTAVVNERAETYTNILANYQRAVELINDPQIGGELVTGTKRTFGKNIPGIQPNMTVNSMISFVNERLNDIGDRDKDAERRKPFEELRASLESLKVGISQLEIRFDYGKVTLNPSWDLSRINQTMSTISVEGQTVDVTESIDALKNLFIDPTLISSQRQSDSGVVQQNLPHQNSARAF